LTEVLFHIDEQSIDPLTGPRLHHVTQLPGKPVSDQLSRSVRDRQQPAVCFGEYPAALFEAGGDFVVFDRHANPRMLGRQQHSVIQIGHEFLGRIPQRDKVKDVAVLVEQAFDFDRDPPVMPVQPLADVAIERDEMPRTEDEVIFGQTDTVTFGGHRTTAPEGRRCRSTPSHTLSRAAPGKSIIRNLALFRRVGSLVERLLRLMKPAATQYHAAQRVEFASAGSAAMVVAG
jgi:hypothetical protein